MSASAPNAMPFRADIEGLRAVAILLVIAAHAAVPGLQGGTIGVDVFYVLSGYLISGLLVAEFNRTGAIALGAFYLRRFRRLLPALALVLACSIAGGALLLAPTEQAKQATAAAWAAIWASNLHFAFDDLDYFGDAAGANIFLHTWSLGVEEQFYLAWPLLVLMALRRSPAALERVMWAVLAAGFAGCLLWTRADPVQAFYMMPSRAWEFALGALVFLRGRATPSRNHAALLGWAGLAALLAGAVVIDHARVYPGAWALFPALGAAALIASGTQCRDAGPARWLSSRPMQGIGRISYAWYLWHWPVLLLGGVVVDREDPLVRVALVALSLMLAAATYAMVERPIRRAPSLLANRRIGFAAAGAVMVVLNVAAIRWHNFAQDWTAEPAQAPYRLVRADLPELYFMGCDRAGMRACGFGAADAGKTAVLIGDSIAAQWSPALERAFAGSDWNLVVITKASCPMVDAVVLDGRGRPFVECEAWRRDALRHVAALSPDAVIVATAYTTALDEAAWRGGSERVLRALAGEVRRLYVVRSTPMLPFDGPRCVEPRSRVYQWLTGPARCDAPVPGAAFDDVHAWVADAARDIPGAKLVDMTDLICPGHRCSAVRDGRFVFRDRMHLTASYAETLAAPLASRLGLDTRAR